MYVYQIIILINSKGLKSKNDLLGNYEEIKSNK